jgi:hypothetical protein
LIENICSSASNKISSSILNDSGAKYLKVLSAILPSIGDLKVETDTVDQMKETQQLIFCAFSNNSLFDIFDPSSLTS